MEPGPAARAAKAARQSEGPDHETNIIAAACVLLAGPALAQSLGEKTGVNSALGVAPATADFVKEVAISDMFEIESSKLAQQKGNAQEKSFAQQMVTDHTKTSSRAEGLVSGGKVQADPADGARQLAPEQARQAQERDGQGFQLGLQFVPGQRP